MIASATKRAKRMARNWRVKVLVQNLLGLLPASVGFPLNEKLTRFVRGSKIEARVNTERRLVEGLENLLHLHEHTGFTLSGKTILEWGTGWHGIDLLLFHLLGARKVVTMDHHRHLTLENLLEQITYLEKAQLPAAMAKLDDMERIKTRLTQLRRNAHKCRSLDELLGLLGARYLIASSCNPTGLDIEAQSIDLFYSNSVLQRIPEKDLETGFQCIGGTLMSDDAAFYHKIDALDVNALGHADANLWRLRYLKYNDFIFHTFISGRFNSQNRLREKNFMDMAERAGITIVHSRAYLRNNDLERMKKFKVARRFSDLSPEELAVVHTTLIGRCTRCRPEIPENKRELLYYD